MSEFKKGTKVLFIDSNNHIQEGVIDMLFDFSDSVIIEKDGVKYKRLYSDIVVKEEKTEKVQEEPKREPVLKAKESITITTKEFEKIGSKVCAEIMHKMNKPSLIIPFSILMSELHMALFFDAVEND